MRRSVYHLSSCAEREKAIRDVNSRIEHLSRIQPQYRLNRPEDFNTLKNEIIDVLRKNGINARLELDPHVYNLYRRYFD